MDRKTLSIGILAITAALLLIACLMPTNSQAAFAVKDRDYQLITAPNQAGGDTVYVVDNRTGQMAVFTFDMRQRVLRLRQVGAVAEAFK